MVVAMTRARSALDFESWYRTAWPRVVAGVGMVCGDRDVASEAAAEAFARALERWESVSVMASPEGWTYVVAVNLLRRRRSRAAVERRALALTDRSARTTIEPDETGDLWRLVLSLPTRERTAIALRYGLGFSEREIAETLRIAPGTVAATLNHGRARLRAALADPDAEVPGG